MPTPRHGKNAYLAVVVAGTTYNLSGTLDDSGINRAVDNAEVTVYSLNDKTYLAGLRGATLPASGHFDKTLEGVLGGVLGASTHPTWKYGPEGNTTGRRKYTYAGMVTKLDVGAPVGNKISMSFDTLVSGAVTSTVW